MSEPEGIRIVFVSGVCTVRVVDAQALALGIVVDTVHKLRDRNASAQIRAHLSEQAPLVIPRPNDAAVRSGHADGPIQGVVSRASPKSAASFERWRLRPVHLVLIVL